MIGRINPLAWLARWLKYCNAHDTSKVMPRAGNARNCRAPAPPPRLPRHVRGPFSVVRRPASRPKPGRASRRCAPNSPGAGLPASSCRAPTATRTNMCRRCEERLAWLTGFTGSAGTRSCWPTAPRCSSTAATRCRRASRSTRRSSRSSTCRRDAARRWLEQTCQPARSSATTRGCTPSKAPSGSRAPAATPARRCRRPSPTRSTRSGPTGRRRRSARWCCTICALPAKTPSPSSTRIRAEIAKPARRRAGRLRSACGRLDLQHPRRRRRAHAAAARLRHRAAGGHARRSTSTARKLGNAVRHKLEELADVREPAALHPRPRRARRSRAAPCGSTRRPRADALVAHRRRRRRQGDARRRSDRHDEGGEEPGRDRGRARRRICATARR